MQKKNAKSRLDDLSVIGYLQAAKDGVSLKEEVRENPEPVTKEAEPEAIDEVKEGKAAVPELSPEEQEAQDEMRFKEVLEAVKEDALFNDFKPEDDVIKAKSSFVIEEKKLNELEALYVKEGQTIPKRLRKAIDDEKAANSTVEQQDVELMDLSAFYERGSDEEDADLGEVVYKELIKTEL